MKDARNVTARRTFRVRKANKPKPKKDAGASQDKMDTFGASNGGFSSTLRIAYTIVIAHSLYLFYVTTVSLTRYLKFHYNNEHFNVFNVLNVRYLTIPAVDENGKSQAFQNHWGYFDKLARV